MASQSISLRLQGLVDAPPSKRPCLLVGVIAEKEDPKVDYLALLPLEMLAEVLSYTNSRDILAVARTSRLFCAILVNNPASQFIWREARKRFFPKPIPEPSPNWTESSYIAFLFDPEPCEVCGQITEKTPFSYSLRARLCKAIKCQTTWRSSLMPLPDVNVGSYAVHVAAVRSWIPYYEIHPHGPCLYRPAELSVALKRHMDSVRTPNDYVQLQQEFIQKASILPRIMEASHRLWEWGDALNSWQLEVQRENTLFLKLKAEEARWEKLDFVNTPLFTSLRKLQSRKFEVLTDCDYELVKDQFLEEVARCREARVRRAIDNIARLNREAIRSYWNLLKTLATGGMPSYPEFRRLGMVRTLERKNTTETMALMPGDQRQSVRQELRNSPETRVHIQDEINVWTNDKRKRLAEILGDRFSALAIAAGFIHPVERTTAWFQCTRCNRVGRSLENNKALTFAGVCAHQCLGLPKNDRLNGSWNIKWFEPDLKAIAASKEILRVCGLDEKTTTTAHLASFGSRFLCKSCPSLIVIDASSVIGHCKRHDATVLQLLTSTEAHTLSPTPVERGLVATLMGFSKSGQRRRQEKRYRCRHCDAKASFTFDGLRSHVKSKHGIQDIRDEDISQLHLPPGQ